MQYENSLAMTRAHPAFGVGPGNWSGRSIRSSRRATIRRCRRASRGRRPTRGRAATGWRFCRSAVCSACLLLALVMVGLMIRAVRDVRDGIGHDPEHVLTSIALVGTLVATAVVGAFDAVLLIAVPTYFVWTLAGALRPLTGGAEVEIDVRRFVPALMAAFAVILIGRSAGQVAAITIASTSTRVDALARATLFDPGNYRLRTRLAEAYVHAVIACARVRRLARRAICFQVPRSQSERSRNAADDRPRWRSMSTTLESGERGFAGAAAGCGRPSRCSSSSLSSLLVHREQRGFCSRCPSVSRR